MLIGITGRARSGKDTLANMLMARIDAKVYSFAKPIKTACMSIFGWSHDHVDGHLKEVVDPFYGVSPRQAMQRLGTEWGRDLINQDLWLLCAQKMVNKYPSPKYNLIIPDVRFENEADFIRRNKGIVVHIERGTAPSVNPHASEAGVEKKTFDVIVYNEFGLDELRLEAENLINFAVDLDRRLVEKSLMAG